MKLKFKTKTPLQIKDIMQEVDTDGQFFYVIENVTAIKWGDIDGT